MNTIMGTDPRTGSDNITRQNEDVKLIRRDEDVKLIRQNEDVKLIRRDEDVKLIRGDADETCIAVLREMSSTNGITDVHNTIGMNMVETNSAEPKKSEGVCRDEDGKLIRGDADETCIVVFREMSSTNETCVRNTIGTDMVEIIFTEPNEDDIVVEILTRCRDDSSDGEEESGDDSEEEESGDDSEEEVMAHDQMEFLASRVVNDRARQQKLELDAARSKHKAKKQLDKKQRVKKAKTKESRQKKLSSALPGEMAMFVNFSRNGKEHTCGLVKRSKDLLLSLVETSDDLIRKYVDFTDSVGKKQLMNQIKDGHYALVCMSEDDDWEVFGMPRNALDEFDRLIKSCHLPSPKLNESCLGRVTLDITGRGNTWLVDSKCDASAKEFLLRMRNEDEELEKTAEELMAEEEEARLAAEEEAEYRADLLEFLAWERARLEAVRSEPVEELKSYCALEESKTSKQAKSQRHREKQQAKLRKTMSLGQFRCEVKAVIDERMALDLCPQSQDVERFPFGCCSSNCRFSGHPAGWDPKENLRRYKAAKKAEKAAQELASGQVKNCQQCRFNSACQRRDTCVFVHTGQLCRHGHDVCSGATCPFFEQYKERRDK
jgi:hypothetical protein